MGVDVYVDEFIDTNAVATEHHEQCVILDSPTGELRVVSMQNLFTNYMPLPSKQPKIHKSYAEQAGTEESINAGNPEPTYGGDYSTSRG